MEFFIAVVIGIVLIFIGMCYTMIADEGEKKNSIQSRLKSTDDFKKYLISKDFNISKELKFGTTIIAVDDINKKWSIHWTSTSFLLKEYPIFNYSQLLDFGVKENGNQIIQGRAGSALTGGVLFGTAGAIVGASRKKEISQTFTLELNIVVNDLNINCINILLLKDVKQNNPTYQTARTFVHEAVALFTYIQNNQ